MRQSIRRKARAPVRRAGVAVGAAAAFGQRQPAAHKVVRARDVALQPVAGAAPWPEVIYIERRGMAPLHHETRYEDINQPVPGDATAAAAAASLGVSAASGLHARRFRGFECRDELTSVSRRGGARLNYVCLTRCRVLQVDNAANTFIAHRSAQRPPGSVATDVVDPLEV